MQIVWFKRDLRVEDHRPLAEAARRGQVLGLYLYEPDVLHAHDFDPSHLIFINECLAELRANLAARGGRLLIRHGDALEVLEDLRRNRGVDALWSHEETGLLHTYARDLAVQRWAKRHGVPCGDPAERRCAPPALERRLGRPLARTDARAYRIRAGAH